MAETGSTQAPQVVLEDGRPRGRINLRGDVSDGKFLAAVAEVAGTGLPQVPNTAVSGANDIAVLWLGPDEWLIETRSDEEEKLAQLLVDSLGELHTAVAAVGDASVTFVLSGSRAVDVLAKGMTLDLDPQVFGPGQCARSLLARTNVLLHRPPGRQTYELTVARSFADYARRWLEDASLEYL